MFYYPPSTSAISFQCRGNCSPSCSLMCKLLSGFQGGKNRKSLAEIIEGIRQFPHLVRVVKINIILFPHRSRRFSQSVTKLIRVNQRNLLETFSLFYI